MNWAGQCGRGRIGDTEGEPSDFRRRGGPPAPLRDLRLFSETSSYGRSAIDAIAQAVGESQLVYGSDRHVIEPVVSGRTAAHEVNGAGLLKRLKIRATQARNF